MIIRTYLIFCGNRNHLLQVCKAGRWFEVVQGCLKVDPDATALAEHAAKLLYMRYGHTS